MLTPTFRGLFARLSLTSPVSGLSPRLPSISASIQTTSFTKSPLPLLSASMSRSIHTTAPQNARAGGKGKKKRRRRGKGQGPDPRIRNLKSSMPRAVPSPLRFARNRALRHWTIHRAWLLFQRKEREREEHELERMYRSMHNACEELRKTSGPGPRDEGFLYRVTMEKKGLFGHHNVPIEYARAQTETPARQPWNHEWTRINSQRD